MGVPAWRGSHTKRRSALCLWRQLSPPLLLISTLFHLPPASRTSFLSHSVLPHCCWLFSLQVEEEEEGEEQILQRSSLPASPFHSSHHLLVFFCFFFLNCLHDSAQKYKR